MDPQARAALLGEVVRIAVEAGERILAIYRTGFAVERKADASPVTAADREAEALILRHLAALTPDIPAVAEEAMAAGQKCTAGERFWLVDPLDGTKEFVNRIGEFTVNIALVEAGLPTLGVVHLPVPGTSYAGAGPGTAAKYDKSGAAHPIAARAPESDGLVMLTSRFHGDDAKLAAFLASYLGGRGETVKAQKTAGSALKFGLIAEGEADFYPRLGPTMEWDTAAGHAVVVAAGGRLETLEGAPLRYGKPEFRNGGFVVRGK
ncbi:MAG: 3'(2'),5'-bisphosphate nucleotidase CysQ [Alphaproteobacteria bacterium]